MNVSTLTQKGQVTIPAEIRKKLDLHPGDKAGFEMTDGEIILRKIQAFDCNKYHHALTNTLSEWSSKEDDEAYDDL